MLRSCLLIVVVSFNCIVLTAADSARKSDPALPVRSGVLTRVNFEDSIRNLYTSIGLEKYNLSYDAFRYGMIGYHSLRLDGKLNDNNLISIIDFSVSANEKRFYTIDLDQRAIRYYSYVSHGRNTGSERATHFSNRRHSNQSSLGFYVTAETYVGSKGYSLRLDGMDIGFNDNMRARAVVMHAAEYVSEGWIERYGRLGRSQGCPALPEAISREVIDTIKGGTLIFAYYPDSQYLTSSSHLNLEDLLVKLEHPASLEAVPAPVSVDPFKIVEAEPVDVYRGRKYLP